MAKISLADRMYITELTPKELQSVKQALTLPNPKYIAAKKFSKYNNISLPPNLTYYKINSNGLIAVPVGFDIEQYAKIDSIKDLRNISESEYPSFLLELREDQKKAAESFLKLNTKNSFLHGNICLPTGKGKTICALYIASALQQKTLVIVHKTDLVLAWQKDIELCFGGAIVPGLIKAQKKDIALQITIATVQTLNRCSIGEIKELKNTFGLVICDEAHHVSASTYSLFEYFSARYKILLTATPERSDGLTPVMFFYGGRFAYKYEITENDQDILPVEVIIRETKAKFLPCVAPDGNIKNFYALNLPKNKVVMLEDIDYSERPKIDYHEMDDAVMTCEDVSIPVLEDITKEVELGHSCIVFLSQKEHCRMYFEKLTELLGNTVQLYYGDTTEPDEEVLARAENKNRLVTIATYSKGTEGTNCKAWEVCFLVSSINNEKNVEQAVGRIRRVKEGKINPVRVYDYRHPYVYMLKWHGATRDTRYQKLGCRIVKAD